MDEFVRYHLGQCGLDNYIQIFQESEIDQQAFRELTQEDLQRLLPGKIGPQAKIRAALQRLQREEELDRLDIEDFYQGQESIGYSSKDEFFSARSELTSPIARRDDLHGNIRDVEWEPTGKALLYIDNSNIFINTQQHSAKLQKFRSGFRSDKRCRIDIGKLYSRARGNFIVLEANLYGSEPPLLDTVWKAIREKHVQVKTHKRSPWTNKEKEIDTAFVADAVEGIIRHSSYSSIQTDDESERKIILFTGDKDMLTVIRKAQKYKWKVEIWSFKVALSNDIEKEARRHPDQITIKLVDDVFMECTFTVAKWKRPYIPTERSMVLLFKKAPKENEKDKKITQVVTASTSILNMPMVARYLESTYEINKEDRDGLISIQNRYQALSTTQCKPKTISYTPMALICYQSSLRKFRAMDGSTGAKKGEVVYDFNKDVWSKRLVILADVPGCSEIISYQQYKQNARITEPEKLEEEDMESDDGEYPDIDYTVIEKKQKKISQAYSEYCENRFRCRHGLKCKYAHNPDEKEFFKEHPNANRSKYKTNLCFYALDKRCKYSERTFLCLFAHNLLEYVCCNCGEVGAHYADECPEVNH